MSDTKTHNSVDGMIAARAAYLQALVESFDDNRNVRATHITILCTSANDNAPMLWDAPVEMIHAESGTLTLNVMPHATGYRNFTPEGLALSVRKNGRPVEMLIPYGLIVGVTLLMPSGEPMGRESFIPIKVKEANDDDATTGPASEPETTTADKSNVVSANFGKAKPH